MRKSKNPPRVKVTLSPSKHGFGYVAQATYEPWHRLIAEGIESNTERNALRQLRKTLLMKQAWIETALKRVDSFEEHIKWSNSLVRSKR